MRSATRRADGSVISVLRSGLAEIVQQARKSHLERGPGVGGVLDDREDVLVERQRLPLGAPACSRDAGANSGMISASTPVSLASRSARAGLTPEQELRELPLPVGRDPSADALGGDVCESGRAVTHLGHRLRRGRTRAATRTATRARAGAGPPGSSSARRCEARAERGRLLRRRGRAGRRCESDRHRVDREVPARHVLLEPDRRVADDREVAVARPGRPFGARWRQLDRRRARALARPGRAGRAGRRRAARDLHVLDAPVRLEELLAGRPGRPRDEKVLVARVATRAARPGRPRRRRTRRCRASGCSRGSRWARRDSARNGCRRSRGRDRPYRCATASISTRAPEGSPATSNVERAGGRSPT